MGLTILAAADAAIEACSPDRRSLAPDRTRARDLVEVGALATATFGVTQPDPASAVARGLAETGQAIARSFPDNIFWDFEFFAGSLCRAALDGGAAAAGAVASRVVALQQLFGHRTAIHFRYVHDFMYGFDWAKWVAKDPGERAAVAPFDPRFLDAMHKRGDELLGLIAHDDDKYPKLPGGQPRNPFGFDREPPAEITLMTDLARADAIPVPAWELAGVASWDRPFAELRKQRAAALGLAHAAPTGP